jgi:hypothetical protein
MREKDYFFFAAFFVAFAAFLAGAFLTAFLAGIVCLSFLWLIA